MTVPYQVKVLKSIHEMPTLDSDWPALTDNKHSLTEYDRTQANIRPVEATIIELGCKIEQLEEEVRFEKTNVLYAQQANQKLDVKNSEWELKCRNLEFANGNLQAQLDKMPKLKRTLQWMMIEHLDLDIELGDK